MANILYRKQKQQISIDNGATWIDMDVYRVGEILENHSNCTSEQTKQCRWVELDITEDYYCDNYNKYSLEVEECTENGLIWTPTGEYRKGSTLIETKSSDCGYNYVITQVSNVLSFKYAGDESLEYKINGETTHTATTSPYSITIEDLGVTSLYNTTSMFEGTRLTELISIPSINNLVYASGMFSHCQDLLFLDLSECPIKATHMDYMFYGCDSLKYLDISSFDTTNTREMNSMFEGCEDLTTLDVSHFVTTSAITMSYMFAFCYKLNSLNVSNFNTSKVTDMSGMFLDCRSLTSLDVSNFNTSKVTDMNNMFNVCSGLTSLDLSNFDTSNVTNVSYMFTACKSLTSLNVTGWDISNINSYTDMFTACSSLSELILGEVSQSTYDWWCARLTEASISCDIIECTILVIPVDLSFEFSTTTTTYKLNGTTYTATSSPHSTSLTELGIETLTSCSQTFSGSSITELTSFPDTSNVTNMSYMFYGCSGLTELDLSGWDVSNVTNMYTMFYYCNNLIKLDLSGWDVSNVTNMRDMFRNCFKIRSINVSGWDISNVTSYSNMFSGCTSLRELIIGDVSEEIYNKWCTIVSSFGITTDLVKYNTNELQDYDLEFYYYMFVNTTAHLPRYPIYINDIEYQANLNNSKWIENNIMRYRLKLSDIGINNVSEITSIDICWTSSSSSCYKTTKIPVYDVSLGCITCGDVSTELVCSLDYSKSTTLDINDKNINCVYDYNINNVTSVTLSTSMETVDISDLQIPKLTSLSSFTYNCKNMVSLDMSGWDISEVTNTYQAFYAMESLRTLNVSGLVYPSSMSQINSYSYMFYGCGITSLILGNVTQEQYNWWCSRLSDASISCNIIEYSIISEPDTPTSDTLSFEFSGDTTTYILNGTTYTATSSPYIITLEELGIETLTSCSQTFYDSKITDLLSFPDTSNVTDMNAMFRDCSGLTSLDLSSFNTSNVTNMRQMFYKCSGLTELDLSNFNTSNVTKMDYIFEKCSGLTSIDLSNWNTSGVTNMNYMFYDCRKLTTLDLSNFNTSNVTRMTGMFGNCSGLTELDLSNFDTSNVTNMSNMFTDCTSLQTLDVSSFDISNVTLMAYMLSRCNSLQTLRIKEGTYDWWCARLQEAGLSCDIIVGDEPDTPTGDTTSDTLSFEFSGSTTTYILNNKTYTATSSPYSTTLDELGIETLTSCDTTFGFNSSITKVTSFPDTSNVTKMDSMFWNCKNITSINLENFNTSNVTSMGAMFSTCGKLTSLDLSSFDTSNVTNMNYMFRDCTNLQTLNVTGWNVLQVTKYTDMFINCTLLNSLILGEVNQSTYDWWCARLTDVSLSCDIIECTIISNAGGGIVDAE